MPNEKQDPFAFAPDRATGVHYIDFVAETFGAVSETNISGPEPLSGEKVPLTKTERMLAYRWLRPTDRPGKIDNQIIRLVIEASPGYERVVVDQNGVVRTNAKEYQLPPLNFLLVSRLLESAANKSARKRKIRRPNAID